MKQLTKQFQDSSKRGYTDKSDAARKQMYHDLFTGDIDVAVAGLLWQRDGDEIFSIAKNCGYNCYHKPDNYSGNLHFKRLKQ